MPTLPIYFYFIALSFLVSLSIYVKPVVGYDYLKLWPIFLFLTLTVELIASFLYESSQNTISLYNFFGIVEFSFYLLNLSLFIRKPVVKKIIHYFIPLYAFLSTINIFFIQGVKSFSTISYSLGCLIIVCFCIYYFFELFRSPKSVKLKNDPAFWICTGLLFFYCCTFPMFALINFWQDISKLFIKNFESILIILNTFLYALITIAFICLRTRNYTLSSS